jgi:hypothetical protein
LLAIASYQEKRLLKKDKHVGAISTISSNSSGSGGAGGAMSITASVGDIIL